MRKLIENVLITLMISSGVLLAISLIACSHHWTPEWAYVGIYTMIVFLISMFGTLWCEAK